MKKSKGITLIALIITIIILLILAAVTVNAIIGENGIIARALESSIVTKIQDILFDIESHIVDINAENLVKNKKFTSTEMMSELEKRGIVTRKNFIPNINIVSGTSLIMNSTINDSRLSNLELSYNGDVWLDNYKRGKTMLSSQTDTIYSIDKKQKVTTIDGNVREYVPNYYILESLKDRDDFACWVNQYSGIVSLIKDGGVPIRSDREEEYVAIYDKELKKKLHNTSNFIGLNSLAYKTPNFYCLEISATFDALGYYYNNPSVFGDKSYHLKFGIEPLYTFLLISDDYNDLMLDDNGVPKSTNFYGIQYPASDYMNRMIPNNYDDSSSGGIFTRMLKIENGNCCCYPAISNEEKLKYNNIVYIAPLINFNNVRL